MKQVISLIIAVMIVLIYVNKKEISLQYNSFISNDYYGKISKIFDETKNKLKTTTKTNNKDKHHKEIKKSIKIAKNKINKKDILKNNEEVFHMRNKEKEIIILKKENIKVVVTHKDRKFIVIKNKNNKYFLQNKKTNELIIFNEVSSCKPILGKIGNLKFFTKETKYGSNFFSEEYFKKSQIYREFCYNKT